MKKKIRNSEGFTLVEMLCVTIVLVLLCLMMNTGVQLALHSYRETVAEAESRVLISTLMGTLCDKLRYAVVTVKADGSYKETSIGEVEIDANGMVTVGGKQLLPEGAYGAGRYKVESIEVTPAIDGSVVIFSVMVKVAETSGEIGLEQTSSVRCLNPIREEV